LELVRHHTTHKALREALEDIAGDVYRGASLSSACAHYPELFEPLVIRLIDAGERVGSLAHSLLLITQYWHDKEEGRKKIRAAALLPSITLLFFVVIVLVILIAVIPRFAHTFASLGYALPKSTKILLCISSVLTSSWSIYLLCIGIASMYAARNLSIFAGIKQVMGKILDRMPFVGTMRSEIQSAYFLYAFGILVQGRVPIITAFKVARGVIRNSAMQEQLQTLEDAIASGKSFALCAYSNPSLFLPDVWAMLAVGQESGQLDRMALTSAQRYKDRTDSRLFIITTVIQPLLMILLGLAVVSMILALYMPIFNLSFVIA
jgi:type II secretory pathway component PulF